MNFWKRLLSDFLSILVPFLICFFVGWMLMVASYKLPQQRITNHVLDSVDQLAKEGDYFSLTDGIKSTVQDNYTEASYLSEALVADPQNANVAALSGGLYSEAPSVIDDLISISEGNEVKLIRQGYYRFWNGYLVVLRFLLLFVSYSGIRYFNICILSILLFFTLVLFNKKGLAKYEFPFLLTFLFMNPVAIALGMAFTGYFIQLFITLILMLLFNDFFKKKNRYLILFTVMGACVFYFNMNYIQLLTFAVPLMLYYLLNGMEGKWKWITEGIRFFAGWFSGYVGMMVGKWILYFIFVDRTIFSQMINYIFYRTSSEIYDGFAISRLDAVGRNASIAFGQSYWLVFEILFVISVLCIRLFRKTRIEFNVKYLLALIMVIMVPAVRYMILANHSYIHSNYMFRLWGITVLGFNFLLCRLFINDKDGINL